MVGLEDDLRTNEASRIWQSVCHPAFLCTAVTTNQTMPTLVLSSES